MQSSTDPRPVVVAVDPSDSARDAAAWAADLAADWAAPLHLVHVVPGDPQDVPRDPLPSWLSGLLAIAERAGAHPCSAEAQPGDLVTTVAARGVGARMVVLGSYGAGAFAGHAGGHDRP
jgi:nucleotide-binding universal stress UspA family protein